MNDQNDTINLTANKLAITLTITGQTRDSITGSIALPQHENAGMDFCWKRSQHPAPYVFNVKGGKQNGRRAKAFAAAVIQAWADGVVSDNDGATVGLGSPVEDYESQLITDGHVRRPCIVRHATAGTILRKATIVNPAKLDTETLTGATRCVARWNMLLEMFRSEHGSPLNFRQWMDSRQAG